MKKTEAIDVLQLTIRVLGSDFVMGYIRAVNDLAEAEKKMHGEWKETLEWVPSYLKPKNVDLVAVVRCRDCRWWNDMGCAVRVVDDSDRPKADDFCSFGERRNNE